MAGDPTWPSWANELVEKYVGGTIIEFVLHGAVHDLVRAVRKGENSYVSLKTFLEEQIFMRRDAIVSYDVSRGITFSNDETFGDFHRVAQAVDAASGTNYG